MTPGLPPAREPVTPIATRVFYFGPLERPGHFLFRPGGFQVRDEERKGFPWDEDSSENGIDCQLQPGCYKDKWGNWQRKGSEIEGLALMHRKDGWTALSFWDRTIDTRGGCNSTYFAEGIFTFGEMVRIAEASFPERWAKMKFEVRLAPA